MYKDDLLDPILEKFKDEIFELPAGSPERSRAVNDFDAVLSAKGKRHHEEEERINVAVERERNIQKEHETKWAEEERARRERRSERWCRVRDIGSFALSLLTLGISTGCWLRSEKHEYEFGNATGFMRKKAIGNMTPRIK